MIALALAGWLMALAAGVLGLLAVLAGRDGWSWSAARAMSSEAR